MGRKRKYFTEEEKREADRVKCRRYYYRNRKRILGRQMEKYWEKKYGKETNRVDS